MVNAAVEVFQLFGEVAGIDLRQVVPPSHALDAHPLRPYMNFTPSTLRHQSPSSTASKTTC
jgi:hypothetical protein